MRSSRYVLTAGAVVAVLAIALIIGFQLRDRTTTVANPSASPTPSASSATVVAPSPSGAATTTPAPTVSPGTAAPGGGVFNDNFGFLADQPGSQSTTSMRRESSEARISGTAFTHGVVAVSPDGTLVAYWRPGPGVSGEGAELRVFDALGNSTEQTFVTLAADQRGGGVAWSSDASALLYSTETGSFGVGGGTNSATLNIYELAANGRHGTTIDSQSNTGWLYRPIAWDRSVNVAAAGLTGEGGFMAKYATVRINADGSFTVQRTDLLSSGIVMSSVRASGDGTLVLGVAEGATVSYWPLADVANRKTASGTGRTGALWQPGTHKIGFLNAGGGFVLFQADDGSAATPFSGVKSGSSVRAFRADGTAVLLAFANQGSTVPGGTDYTLYRLSDGASVTVPEAGQLSASVRLR